LAQEIAPLGPFYSEQLGPPYDPPIVGPIHDLRGRYLELQGNFLAEEGGTVVLDIEGQPFVPVFLALSSEIETILFVQLNGPLLVPVQADVGYAGLTDENGRVQCIHRPAVRPGDSQRRLEQVEAGPAGTLTMALGL